MGLKFLSVVPSQRRLNWCVQYIDKKEDALYGLVFAYQLIEAYLRGLIFWKTKNHKSTDKFGFKNVIKQFINSYPKRQKLGKRLNAWAERRDAVIHHLLTSTRITNAQKLDRLIKEVGDKGLRLFLELKNIKHG